MKNHSKFSGYTINVLSGLIEPVNHSDTANIVMLTTSDTSTQTDQVQFLCSEHACHTLCIANHKHLYDVLSTHTYTNNLVCCLLNFCTPQDPPILPDYPPLYKMCKEIEEDTQSRLTQVDYLYREELGSTHISKASLTSLMKSVNPPRVSESEPMILSRFLDEFDDGSWKSKSDTFQPHNECDKNEFEVPDIQSSSEIDSIHEIELQDKLHSCAVMDRTPCSFTN